MRIVKGEITVLVYFLLKIEKLLTNSDYVYKIRNDKGQQQKGKQNV